MLICNRAYLEYLQLRAEEGSRADKNKSNLASERLRVKIQDFNERIRAIHPTLEDIPIPDDDDPAKSTLPLPSTLGTAVSRQLGLQELAAAEARLRIGSCFDQIGKLKDALGVRSFLTRHARTQQGYNGATRNQDAIRRAEANVKRHGRNYRRSWQALDGLSIPIEQRSGLQDLLASDMTILGQWLEGAQYRKGGSKLPWIWSVQPINPGPHSADEGNDVEAAVESWNKEGRPMNAPILSGFNQLTIYFSTSHPPGMGPCEGGCCPLGRRTQAIVRGGPEDCTILPKRGRRVGPEGGGGYSRPTWTCCSGLSCIRS